MLTDIFYYDYYKAYIVREVDGASAVSRRKIVFDRFLTDSVSAKPGKDEKTIRMNKARTGEVSSFARNLAHGVIWFKDAVKHITQIGERFVDFTWHDYDFDNFSYELSAFAESYNTCLKFKSEQEHSQIIKSCADEQLLILNEKKDLLLQFGFSFTDGGNGIMFDEKLYKSRACGSYFTHDSMIELRDTFESVYNLSKELMTIPLSEHMEFYDLKFYYNYQPYISAAETFGIVESGMIVDMAV